MLLVSSLLELRRHMLLIADESRHLLLSSTLSPTISILAPAFNEDGRVTKRATFTVCHNGVLVQDHVEVMGVTTNEGPPYYKAHADRLPISLQDHNHMVKYRNIWLREL